MLCAYSEQAHGRRGKVQSHRPIVGWEQALLPEVIDQVGSSALQTEACYGEVTRYLSFLIPIKITDEPPGAELCTDGQGKELRPVLLEQVERPRSLAVCGQHLGKDGEPCGIQVVQAVSRNHGAPREGNERCHGLGLRQGEQRQTDVVSIVYPGTPVEVIALGDCWGCTTAMFDVMFPGRTRQVLLDAQTIDESYGHLPWTTVEEIALWSHRCTHGVHAEPIGLGSADSGVIIALDSQQCPLDEVDLDEVIPPDLNNGVNQFP